MKTTNLESTRFATSVITLCCYRAIKAVERRLGVSSLDILVLVECSGALLFSFWACWWIKIEKLSWVTGLTLNHDKMIDQVGDDCKLSTYRKVNSTPLRPINLRLTRSNFSITTTDQLWCQNIIISQIRYRKVNQTKLMLNIIHWLTANFPDENLGSEKWCVYLCLSHTGLRISKTWLKTYRKCLKDKPRKKRILIKQLCFSKTKKLFWTTNRSENATKKAAGFTVQAQS